MVEGLLKAGHDTLGVTGKGNKARLVPLLPQALEALKAYREACPIWRPSPQYGVLRRRAR